MKKIPLAYMRKVSRLDTKGLVYYHISANALKELIIKSCNGLTNHDGDIIN